MTITEALERLRALDRNVRHLGHAVAVLSWDQETGMPPAAVEERAEQLAVLGGIAHEKAVDPEIGRLLERLGSDQATPAGDPALSDLDRDFVRVVRREYDRAVKLPRDLVEDSARAEGLSQAAWAKAREADDFAAFAPHLRAMLGFAKKKAACWGFADRPYDGMIDLYEPGMSEASIAAAFGPLSRRLSGLVGRIASKGEPDVSFLEKDYPVEGQDAFARKLMVKLGYPTDRGRLDLSAHPFSTTLGADDSRITTRYFTRNVLSGLFSVIHETGHALYELGFGADIRGSALAEGASMGIHESQSRLWENVVGRSAAFWRGRFDDFKAAFPAQLAGVGVDDFYRAVNAVKPSLIRTDADEVTYSLHVALRFDLERRLFSGELDVDQLPAAWRRAMKDLLGVEPETDADGVLQDIHWSMGSFGYFPSYALGNLYGLQFWKALRKDLPDVDLSIERGEYAVVLGWLRERVHARGRRLDPAGLLAAVAGEALSPEPFLDYLETKYAALYSL